MQCRCNEITESECGGKAVNIDFVDDTAVDQQRALCVSGKLMTIGDLHHQFEEQPQTTPQPGMASVAYCYPAVRNDSNSM